MERRRKGGLGAKPCRQLLQAPQGKRSLSPFKRGSVDAPQPSQGKSSPCTQRIMRVECHRLRWLGPISSRPRIINIGTLGVVHRLRYSLL